MAIEDPTAIPESAEAADEYLREAAVAFDAGNHDAALPLYYAAVMSTLLSEAEDSIAQYRLAVMYVAAGDNESAHRFAFGNTQPGAADLLRAITAESEDAPVDPSEPPQSTEDIVRYYQAAGDAQQRGDGATEEALRQAIANSPAASPGMVAEASVRVAQIAKADGRTDEAHQWAQSALANASRPEEHDAAVAVLRELGVAVDESNPYETEGSRQLVAGKQAWEGGDQAAAQASFQAVLDADDVTTADKGAARFYLGSMAYYAKDFDTAREHLQQAARDADDPEKTWATEMLEWRWQEEG